MTELRAPRPDPASARISLPRGRRPVKKPPSDRPPPAPIVPTDNLAGQALVMVIAIMTFLASLTIGAVDLVSGAARAWESDVSREITIQIPPAEGMDMEALLQQATMLARETPGIASAAPLDLAATARLLEPWLGPGADMDALPVPRLVIINRAEGQHVDLTGLRDRLAAAIPSAMLDDHSAWIERLTGMARILVGTGLVILLLMTAATILSVVFATRGAMSGNRDIINVLHVIGARDSYIARAFERRFFILAGRGAAYGGGAALLIFGLCAILAGNTTGSTATEQMSMLFGRFAVSWTGYIAVIIMGVTTALATALTSRLTVVAQLRHHN